MSTGHHKLQPAYMDRLTNQASENSFRDKAIVDGAYSTYWEEVERASGLPFLLCGCALCWVMPVLSSCVVQGPSSVNPPELMPYLLHNILVHGPSHSTKSVSYLTFIWNRMHNVMETVYTVLRTWLGVECYIFLELYNAHMYA